MTNNQATIDFSKYRYIGAKGTPIQMHRALRKLTVSPAIIFSIIVLPIFFDALLYAKLDAIMMLWNHIIHFCITKLNINGDVAFAQAKLLHHKFTLPYPELTTVLPSNMALLINFVACIILYLVAGIIGKKHMPMAYILRAAFIIQITASIYFYFSPTKPPYELNKYLEGMYSVGVYLLFLLTPLLALVYYIFDIGLLRKIVATALIIAYFIVLIPFQYMLHAYIISSWSFLFMPVLYLLFGLLLDFLMFVSFYSWAMSWRNDSEQPLGY